MDLVPLGIVALVFPLIYLGGAFAVVYWAARLAIRHERSREARAQSQARTKQIGGSPL